MKNANAQSKGTDTGIAGFLNMLQSPRGRGTYVLSITLCALLCLSLPALAADQEIVQFLPPKACSDGWVMEDKPVLYTKENLFDYINGEAELYFPYGFEVLATARYVNVSNPAVSLVMDVYKMGSLKHAFGMYANYRRSDDVSVKAGADAVISPSQMLMYQDRYYIRLQASGAPEIEKNIFLACVQSLSKNLPQNFSRPRELAVFGIAAVTPNSERYIAQSLLGYAFFRHGYMADATMSGEQVQVFMVPEASEELAQKTLDQYRAYLRDSGKDAKMSGATEHMALEAIDPLYQGVSIQQAGRYLIGVVRMNNPAAAESLLGEIRIRLPR